MTLVRKMILATGTAAALTGVAMADTPVSYATPYTAAIPSGVVDSWSGALTAGSPTYRRANGSANGSETAPNAPASQGGLASNLYRYDLHSYTPSVSGLYQFYSAQAFDGFMHLYGAGGLVPATPLLNILAGDDDMTTLNGGAVPNRGGVVGSGDDSGFQYNLVAGTTYQITTTSYSTTAPTAPNNNFYNEIRGGGSPASPVYSIPDNDIVTGLDITLNIANSDNITAFTSVDLTNLAHTWVGDLEITLTHVDTGTSAIILDELDAGTGGNGRNINGNYTLSDTGAAWPAGAGADIAPGTYASSNPLSIFVGESIGGTWVLHITDSAGADTGTISAFGLNVMVPTPGSAALLGFGLLASGRRRRA